MSSIGTTFPIRVIPLPRTKRPLPLMRILPLNRVDKRHARVASDAKLSIEKRRGQERIVNDFHYFARADAHAIGIGGGGSTGGIHSLSPVVAFADAVRVRPSSPCDRTTKGVPSLITNSNLEPADKVPASFMPPRAAGPGRE